MYNNTTTQLRLRTIALTTACADEQADCSGSVLPPTKELQQAFDKLSKAERKAVFTFSQDALRKQALKDTKEVIANAKGVNSVASTCICMLLPRPISTHKSLNGSAKHVRDDAQQISSFQAPTELCR